MDRRGSLKSLLRSIHSHRNSLMTDEDIANLRTYAALLRCLILPGPS